MDDLVYVESGGLCMSPDNGTVYIRAGEDVAYLGFVGDADNCPDGLEENWAWLLEWWDESGRTADAYARTAEWSYYDRLSVPRMNQGETWSR